MECIRHINVKLKIYKYLAKHYYIRKRKATKGKQKTTKRENRRLMVKMIFKLCENDFKI